MDALPKIDLEIPPPQVPPPAPSAPDVFAAVSRVSAALAAEGVGKTGYNKDQGYRFRGIDAFMDSLAPILPREGLCIFPRVLHRDNFERTSRNGGALFVCALLVEYTLVSVRDGSRFVVGPFAGDGMDSADKSVTKAMSSAWKYMAAQTFVIPIAGASADVEDDDHEVSPKRAPAARPPFREAVANLAQVMASKGGANLSKDEARELVNGLGDAWANKSALAALVGLLGRSGLTEVPAACAGDLRKLCKLYAPGDAFAAKPGAPVAPAGDEPPPSWWESGQYPAELGSVSVPAILSDLFTSSERPDASGADMAEFRRCAALFSVADLDGVMERLRGGGRGWSRRLLGLLLVLWHRTSIGTAWPSMPSPEAPAAELEALRLQIGAPGLAESAAREFLALWAGTIGTIERGSK